MSESPPLRGFILQPTYRVEDGRPVVHLFGRLEDGRSFLVRDTREIPHFYVEGADAPRARALGAKRQSATEQTTLWGNPVVRVEVATPAETPPLRERLSRGGVRTHEADVRFAMRPLIDRGIRGSLEILGDGTERPRLGVVFEDPALAPGDWTPSPEVLSLDIETERGHRGAERGRVRPPPRDPHRDARRDHASPRGSPAGRGHVRAAMRRAPEVVTVTKEHQVSIGPLVEDEVVGQYEPEVDAQAYPEVAEKIRETDALIAATASLSSMILNELRKDGPLESDRDLVAEAAKASDDAA